MDADERLNQAYRLRDRFLEDIQALQAMHSVNYDRQAERVGLILTRVLGEIEAKCRKRNDGKI